MSESFSVNDSWCPMHGIGARQRRTTVPNTASAGQITWWECPQCNVSTTIPVSATTTNYVHSTPIPDADAARLLTEQPALQTTGWEAMLVRHVRALEARLHDAERRETAWAEVDEAQQIMLAAYRTGNHRRVDAALTKIEAARAALAARATPRGAP